MNKQQRQILEGLSDIVSGWSYSSDIDDPIHLMVDEQVKKLNIPNESQEEIISQLLLEILDEVRAIGNEDEEEDY